MASMMSPSPIETKMPTLISVSTCLFNRHSIGGTDRSAYERLHQGVLRLLDVLNAVIYGYFSIVENRDAVSNFEGARYVVSHENAGDSLLLQLEDVVDQALGVDRIETGG